jgi:hypothetical protein
MTDTSRRLCLAPPDRPTSHSPIKPWPPSPTQPKATAGFSAAKGDRIGPQQEGPAQGMTLPSVHLASPLPLPTSIRFGCLLVGGVDFIIGVVPLCHVAQSPASVLLASLEINQLFSASLQDPGLANFVPARLLQGISQVVAN